MTILGCSSAKPTATYHQSSQVVNVNEQLFLVDCGEGCQQQMFRSGISLLKIRAVFISHMHGDHVFGLFPLLSTMGLYGRRMPLSVYAPRPMGELLEVYRSFFDKEAVFPIEWIEVDTTKNLVIFENRTTEVVSVPLRHSVPACGYIFREKSAEYNIRKEKIEEYNLSVHDIVALKRGEDIVTEDGIEVKNEDATYLKPALSYAYCSDTSKSMMVARRVSGVNLLYHEATYTDEYKKVARSRGHSTSREAAEVAAAANVGKLLIGHFSSRYKSFEKLLEEARELFPETYTVEENQTYEIR